ncbi:serine threonine- kinase pim-3-like protein [Labeo rohita]|uniref:non-specific serine/threonine protein kinase n=1 Tax=Labeo rohita TaxID=84645 RepID=A0A498L305_LABRO|nr:serine threonine- kinase pim-3-like protein [Labeo rohita]
MAAGQEVGGQCGDHIQKTLSNPTQPWSPELPGYIAPLPSESTQRKRKRQSLEDEDPSTSYERPAKRSREDSYIKGPMLGQGGFGSVFAGTRSSDGLPVAIKYVTKDEEHEDVQLEGQGLLPLEVALMTRVNSAPACPNVLKLLEWFEHPGRYVMILERPDPCQDLHSFCEENGCLDESQAKKVLMQLISALKHCESRGVFHRDVKPQNLLICTDTNEIKLLDFGCGHLLKDSEYKEFAGTLSFAPPEWFRSHSYRAGPATAWSLGVTLYQLLCGSLPFRSARRVRRLCFPRHLSADCRQLIRWCLKAAADDRPSLQDIEQHPWLQSTDNSAVGNEILTLQNDIEIKSMATPGMTGEFWNLLPEQKYHNLRTCAFNLTALFWINLSVTDFDKEISLTSALGRSRSAAAFTQMAAGQEGGGQCGDYIQKTLSNPTQPWSPELPGYIAPLPSESTQRKRKRQSLEDEDPSTSYERPAKRSREDSYIKGPVLGQGGFGSVFAGTRSSDGLPVAIKYVTKDEEHEDTEVEGQGLLPLEVALMTRVNSAPACPNVLKLLEWFEHPGRYVMILERPDPCQDLHSFCEENGCLDESQAKKVLMQLINALKHCESRGVFHRDVKPQNLLICTDSNEIKLLDFGCGHLLKDSEYKEFAGTLSFAPPEWFRSHSYRAGPATAWSLGVPLYQLLCGSLPFRSARRVRRLRFPRHLSADCRQLIRWCLKAAADDRPSLQDIEQHPWLQSTVKEMPIHSAVDLQGAVLGRHEEEIFATRHAVESLAAQITDLTNRLHLLQSQSPSLEPRTTSEPRINNPPCYSASHRGPEKKRILMAFWDQQKPENKLTNSQKRKRQSLEDEDPSTSYERPAKRSREDSYIKGPMLGQGGFGSVFAGTRSSDGLPVAIKYVTKDEEHEDIEVEGQGLLPLEVALMTWVNSAPACPNVLKLLEWFEHPGRYVMILERPDPCQDLHSFCEENGCLDESQAKKVLMQLINALKHCESRGVFHRDVKPQNLLICTDSNEIKLLDFGCGHLLKDSEYKEFAGTLSFAPPEWFRSHSYRAGPATAWSLGVTLYQLLCGSLPFRSARRVRRLRLPRHLSADCRQLIRWCLKAAADDRPSLQDIEQHPWLQSTASHRGPEKKRILMAFWDQQKPENKLTNSQRFFRIFSMAHMGERRALGRSRSAAAFTQMAAGQEVGGQCGDYIQKTLSNPTQPWSPELPGYIAPLPSESTQRKRKRQSLEDEDPSTSYERPAKRSREDSYIKGPMLGQGGFGSVFAGTRSSDGLPVAIKYVTKDEEHEDIEVEGQGLLPLEVALMTRVNSAPACPNVLKLLEWFEHPGRYVMILERPDPCQDLHSFCEENGCLDESQAKKVLMQLINALKHCESCGVFHRDVKPQNLLICTDTNEIKLLDFGCGHLLKDSEYKEFAGTLSFAPPEWFRSHSYRAGPATAWSLGVTLYQLLCGSLPFRSARRVRRLRFPRHLSADCRQLIRWCLKAAADDRPSLQDIEQHPWLQSTAC